MLPTEVEGLHNTSYPTQPHAIITNYRALTLHEIRILEINAT